MTEQKDVKRPSQDDIRLAEDALKGFIQGTTVRVGDGADRLLSGAVRRDLPEEGSQQLFFLADYPEKLQVPFFFHNMPFVTTNPIGTYGFTLALKTRVLFGQVSYCAEVFAVPDGGDAVCFPQDLDLGVGRPTPSAAIDAAVRSIQRYFKLFLLSDELVDLGADKTLVDCMLYLKYRDDPYALFIAQDQKRILVEEDLGSLESVYNFVKFQTTVYG